jgi:tRNA pseudouridine55 synthase
VTVASLDVLAMTAEEVEIEVRCSPGTYIRALARDLGQALGVGGHLTALRRTRSGAFGLDQAVAWDELGTHGSERLLSLSSLLPEMPAARVGARGAEELRHGRDLGPDLVVTGFPDGVPPPRVRILDEGAGNLLALAVPRGFGPAAPGLSVPPVLHPDVVLSD